LIYEFSSLVKICNTAVDLFIQHAWPGTKPLWDSSTCRVIPERVLLWQLFPCPQTYNLLPPDFRPTELQLCTPHSIIIDGVPFAPLRDRLIMYHNNSATLDNLFSDMMNCLVVGVEDVSKILVGVKQERGYFGVWNIFSVISGWVYPAEDSRVSEITERNAQTIHSAHRQMKDAARGSRFDHLNQSLFDSLKPFPDGDADDLFTQHLSSSTWEPIPWTRILSSPSLALKLCYHIGMDKADGNWRFDRALYETYPELKWNGFETTIAQGRSYRIPGGPPMNPEMLTHATIDAYKKGIRACFIT
jgi:hypothetical protein